MKNNSKNSHSPSGTSFEEQAIYYYIKQLFSDAINRGNYSFDEKEKIELDIYIPSLHFAIEYDGVYWHKEKAKSDINKNLILSDAGIYLVRVRECGLDDLEFKYGDVIYRKTSPLDNGFHLHEVINEIFKIIKKHTVNNNLSLSVESQNNINSFLLNQQQLFNDRPKIYAQYYTTFQEDNITTTCLIKHWDYEKNGNLLPENVSINSKIFIFLTCPKGEHFQIQPYRYNLKSNAYADKCSNCFFNYCPSLYGDCPVANKCDIHNELTNTIAYMPAHTQSQYNPMAFNRAISVSEISCSIPITNNLKFHYDIMWTDIERTIIDRPDSISKSTVETWIRSTIRNDHCKMFYMLWKLGKKHSKNLSKILKNMFLDRLNLYIPNAICIDQSIPKKDIIKMLKALGSRRFLYPSLQYFDDPVLMKDFCDLLLIECRRGDSVISQINYVALTTGIEKEYQLLSPLFSAYLYDLITQLEHISRLPHSEECKELLYAKAQPELKALKYSD